MGRRKRSAARWARLSGEQAGSRVPAARGAGLLRRAVDRPARWRSEAAGARRWVVTVGAGCAGFLLVEGVAGVVVGALTAAGARWFDRRRPAAGSNAPPSAGAELPLAADLLAACVAAGAQPVVAARAVGESLGGPVGSALSRGAGEVRLGARPTDAWRELAALPDGRALALLLARAGESGAPAAVPVARYAAEVRARWARVQTARARRAGVLITAPVGLCFLPAFVVIGVLPVVIGLAGRLLGGDGG
ncbi:type II secretion system F family protein [Streptomyces sp. NPDC059578]|uniref:type II secretion system F family protein n=1 Tax=unclassified Streptomyces TaxID=2593676 RepID=UPI003648A1A2